MLLSKLKFLLLMVALSLAVTVPVLAAAPQEGIVVEGERVPGIALGVTRAQVEAAIGHPRSCSSVEEPADFASCTFDMEGGGLVWVRYRGPDGGNASNSPDDVVRSIYWGDVDGWVTITGINTTLALADPQAVIDAYPNAEVTYNMFGWIYSVRDPELGIEVTWNYDFYGGFTTVSMWIFTPYTPPPPPDMIHVADIVMTSDRRSVTGRVLVLDDQDQPVEGALVEATWSYPKVNGLQVSAETASDGIATFRVDKAPRGVYYLKINEVSLEGFVYDNVHSTTLGVFSKPK